MKKTSILLAGLTLAVSALTAFTQPAPGDESPRPSDGPPGGPAGKGRRPPPLPLIVVLDANHDGIIDAQEIANAPAALKTLDKNNDGQLTPDEYMPPRRGPGGSTTNNAAKFGQRPPPPPIVAALDANHDGVIDAQEIANASAALKTLDKNNDGQLTPDELRPPWAGPRGPRGQGPGGPPPGGGSNDAPPGGPDAPPPADN